MEWEYNIVESDDRRHSGPGEIAARGEEWTKEKLWSEGVTVYVKVREWST